jgi:hypothetical protein
MGRSTVLSGCAAIIAPEACEPIWRILRAELQRRRSDGGQIRPEVVEALDVLRAAAAQHLADVRTDGHVSRTSADIDSCSEGESQPVEYSTDQLANRLHVGTRHARRLAAAHGVTPIGRDRWSSFDVAALESARRTG